MWGTAHRSPHGCLDFGRNALGRHRVGELQQAGPPGIETCWRRAHDTVIPDRDSVIVGPYEYDPVPAGALGSVQRRVSPAEKPRQTGVDFPVGGDADTHGGAHRKSAHEAGGFGKVRAQTLPPPRRLLHRQRPAGWLRTPPLRGARRRGWVAPMMRPPVTPQTADISIGMPPRLNTRAASPHDPTKRGAASRDQSSCPRVRTNMPANTAATATFAAEMVIRSRYIRFGIVWLIYPRKLLARAIFSKNLDGNYAVRARTGHVRPR